MKCSAAKFKALIDLHTHSRFSDGSDQPEALIEIAARAGCTTIALTDHDTVGGVAIAQAKGAELGVNVIAGVELSCHTPNRTVHLLGYFLDVSDISFQEHLEAQRDLRNRRNQVLIERLNVLGLAITMDQVLEHVGNESVGRPHVAAALVANGYCETIDEAFRRWLSQGAPGYVERQELPVEEGIAWIKAAGGVASWAHPMTPKEYADTDLQPDLELMVSAGLVGLECWYSRYEASQRTRLTKLARKAGLIPTGGSDYHGTFKADIALGVGQGDLRVPDEVVDELKSRLP